MITNWKQAKPDLVQVYQYEADGKFDRLAAQEPLAYAAEIHVSETTKTQGLVLAPKDKALRHLSTSRDYKIVIDSRLEYRVYDVVSSNEPRWGCPIKSAKVNTCVAPSDSVIQFDADCR